MSTTSTYDSRISSQGSGTGFAAIIALLLALGVVYTGIRLYDDLVSAPLGSVLPYILLGIALLIALGFEMCNGFHDTSNALSSIFL
jgi:PiT family inorganic phosphate transporter